MKKRILLLGAAGRIGKILRPGLKDPNRILRLVDIAPLGKAASDEEIFDANILEPVSLEKSMQGVDCIIHLAGYPEEAPWEVILPANINGTFNVFEAARKTGVKRIIFASTNRVVSFYRRDRSIDTSMPPRPEGLYSASKVFCEGLARLYADKYGISVACLRIGSFEEKPKEPRHLITWVSHRDLTHLVDCCLKAPYFHFLTIFAVSANTRNKWHSPDAKKVGYHPVDNAEDYADALKNMPEDEISKQFNGGKFCSKGLTCDPAKID